MKTSQGFIIILLYLTFLLDLTLAQQQQPIDPAMLYVQQFQQVMTSIYPTERFTFDLTPGQERTISIWSQADTESVDIAFYINNDDDPTQVTGQGFFASCEINGAQTHTFKEQKLGACQMAITSRPSFIKLHFRSQQTPVTIYLQYEIKKFQIQTIPNQSVSQNQNVPTEQQDKRQKLGQISQRFQKVKKRTQLQQGALRLLTKSFNKHNTRFEKNLKYAYHRLMVETGLVILSGLVGLWILKKQMGNGYEMLV